MVITRFGIVLGRGGGALGQMAPMFRRFLGGPLGSGQQWFSWIHQADQVRAFTFVREHPEIHGPVNFTAPHPVRNYELTKALGRVLHRPTLLPAPAFMMRLVLGGIRRRPADRSAGDPEETAGRGIQVQFSDYRRGVERFADLTNQHRARHAVPLQITIPIVGARRVVPFYQVRVLCPKDNPCVPFSLLFLFGHQDTGLGAGQICSGAVKPASCSHSATSP